MNPVQENAIREADNYLKAAGLPTYTQVTAEPTEEQIAAAVKVWFDTPGEGVNSFPIRMKAALKAAKS